MDVTFIRERSGNEFLKDMEKIYGSIEDLEKLAEKDPNHPLYKLDLHDWLHLQEKPNGTVETNHRLHAEDLIYEFPEIHEIVINDPLIRFHFPFVEQKDLLETEIEFPITKGRLTVKFEPGEITPRPIMTFKELELKID